MNRRLVSGCGHEDKALLFDQFAQQTHLTLPYFSFIGFESCLNKVHALAQQPVERQSQLARQRHVGGQPSDSPPQASVKASERLIYVLG